MANGNPKFGGSNGVAELDLGQEGGALHTAGTVKLGGVQVVEGGELKKKNEHQGPQLAVKFEDNLGPGGRRITWRGIVKAATLPDLRAIYNSLNLRAHGYGRDPVSGKQQPADLTEIKPTQITDIDGTVLTTKATLESWRVVGRRNKTTDGRYVQQIEVTFSVLL